jgi:hypothetical protein
LGDKLLPTSFAEELGQSLPGSLSTTKEKQEEDNRQKDAEKAKRLTELYLHCQSVFLERRVNGRTEHMLSSQFSPRLVAVPEVERLLVMKLRDSWTQPSLLDMAF